MISFINKMFLFLLLSVFVVACGDSPEGNKNTDITINGNKDDAVDKDSDLGKEVLSRTQGKLDQSAQVSIHYNDGDTTKSPMIGYDNAVAWKAGFSEDFSDNASPTRMDFSNHLVNTFATEVRFYTKKGVWYATETRTPTDILTGGFHMQIQKVQNSASVKMEGVYDDSIRPRYAGTWLCSESKFPAGTTVDDLAKVYAIALWEADGTKYFEYLPTLRLTFKSGSASIVTC